MQIKNYEKNKLRKYPIALHIETTRAANRRSLLTTDYKEECYNIDITFYRKPHETYLF